MTQEMILLLSTAAFLGFFHTLPGLDHYLHFIVMGKARQWSMAKTNMDQCDCNIFSGEPEFPPVQQF